jgi:DNA-binding NarL/FixJ family response regulator
MKSVRILLVEDKEFIRQGLRVLVEKQEGWEVVGEAVNGRDAVVLAECLDPDVVVMDISIPSLNGLEATRQIVRSKPHIRVLVLSQHDSEPIIRQVLASGARGYILKSDASTDLVTAVEALVAGKPFFTPQVSEVLLAGYLRQLEAPPLEITDALSPLTLREREILQLLAQGRSNKEVAARLNISSRTVETHRRNLMGKLNLHSIAEIVRYAVRNRMSN